MAETPKSFRVKYEVHCRIENFFGKEIVVKRCYSELHAKVKLHDFCVKKYGPEFDFLKVISVTCEDSDFSDLFDKTFGKSDSFMDSIFDILKNKKK